MLFTVRCSLRDLEPHTVERILRRPNEAAPRIKISIDGDTGSVVGRITSWQLIEGDTLLLTCETTPS